MQLRLLNDTTSLFNDAPEELNDGYLFFYGLLVY